MESLFLTVNIVALSAWALLILAPRRLATQMTVRSLALPGALALIYLALLINEVALGAASGNGGFTSIAGVQGFFEAPNGAVMGWTHFLVFDLFVGIWIVEQSEQRNLTQWLVLPSLVLTMLFGPLGFLLFYGIGFRRREPS